MECNSQFYVVSLDKRVSVPRGLGWSQVVFSLIALGRYLVSTLLYNENGTFDLLVTFVWSFSLFRDFGLSMVLPLGGEWERGFKLFLYFGVFSGSKRIGDPGYREPPRSVDKLVALGFSPGATTLDSFVVHSALAFLVDRTCFVTTLGIFFSVLGLEISTGLGDLGVQDTSSLGHFSNLPATHGILFSVSFYPPGGSRDPSILLWTVTLAMGSHQSESSLGFLAGFALSK